MILLLLLGCGEPAPTLSPEEQADAAARALYQDARPTAAPVPPPGSAAAPATPAPATPAATPTDTPKPVDLFFTWHGLAPMYRGFFKDPTLGAALGAGLVGLVSSPVRVHVAYDDVAVRGTVHLLPTEDSGLLIRVHNEGDLFRLQDLAPITVALSAFRDGLGSRYDLRLLNFRVSLDLIGGGHSCKFVPAGDPPPDGGVLSPCVEVDGERVCGVASAEGVTFPWATATAIRACLKP